MLQYFTVFVIYVDIAGVFKKPPDSFFFVFE